MTVELLFEQLVGWWRVMLEGRKYLILRNLASHSSESVEESSGKLTLIESSTG